MMYDCIFIKFKPNIDKNQATNGKVRININSQHLNTANTISKLTTMIAMFRFTVFCGD